MCICDADKDCTLSESWDDLGPLELERAVS